MVHFARFNAQYSGMGPSLLDSTAASWACTRSGDVGVYVTDSAAVVQYGQRYEGFRWHTSGWQKHQVDSSLVQAMNAYRQSVSAAVYQDKISP
jgi:hypothetical protein